MFDDGIGFKKINNVKVFLIFASVFILSLVMSNIVAQKVIEFTIPVINLNIISPAGAFIFCLSFVVNDLITEVYGYKWARFIIWIAILCNLIAVFFIYIAIKLPSAHFWQDQTEYANILGSVPRVVLASCLSMFLSEILNSYIISKLKVIFKGRFFAFRALSSTFISVLFDSLVFIPIAYFAIADMVQMFRMAAWLFLFKVLYEIIMLMFTYKMRSWLIKIEGYEIFDFSTNYSPFSFNTDYTEAQSRRFVL